MPEGPVYGDILSAFSELVDEYTVFRMSAQAGAGYNSRTGHIKLYGIFRKVPGAKMSIMGDNRTPNGAGSLYAYAEEAVGVPSQGMYMEVDNVLYILTKDNNYSQEGGYVRFIANIVPGPTDKQARDTNVLTKARNALQ